MVQPIFSENGNLINFKKADWESFTALTELEFEKLVSPVNVYKTEATFRKIINKISKVCIPARKIKKIIPDIPTEAAVKIVQRDELRRADPTSPEISQLNEEICIIIAVYKRDKCRETVEEIKPKTNSGKLFKLIKSLNGKASTMGGN